MGIDRVAPVYPLPCRGPGEEEQCRWIVPDCQKVADCLDGIWRT